MGSPPVMFLRAYDETLDMIVEARDYMTYVEPRQRAPGKGAANLRMSCEALRVTSRLTQVMAWLMLQRAVQYGEISQQEACQECHRISGRDVCLDTSAIEDDSLPPGLISLLDRSFRLYQRISRLEEMVLTRVLN